MHLWKSTSLSLSEEVCFRLCSSRSFIYLLAPKEVVEEEIDHTKPRRKSSLYEAFVKGAKTSLGRLSVRIYTGFFFEGLPLLIFAIIYPTQLQATVLSFIVGIGDSLAQSGIFPLAGQIHPRCTGKSALVLFYHLHVCVFNMTTQ
jgi:hypothetical protein